MPDSPPDRSDGLDAGRSEGGLLPDERAIAAAIQEFIDRAALDESVDVAAFCDAHPALAPRLRPLLDAFVAMDADLQQPDFGGEVSSQLPEPAPLPARLSGHKILGEIGAGGMGRVLLAYDEGLRRKVAIKQLSPRFSDNRSLQTRFMQEARALALVRHPNIVSIYRLGQSDEPPHFVMELVEGTTLLEAARALTFEQKAELMEKVALAVDYLHQHGLLHRDLKPANILVGANLEPKLLDFGLARQLYIDDEFRTLPGDLVGTPDYFSPEQTHSGAVLDKRSDVFSMGTIFYQLLTGALPFRGESRTERLQKVREANPVLPRRLNSDVPGDLQNICLKALEKNPADRYGSGEEMADDLKRFLAGEKVLAAPTSYSHLMSAKIEQHLRELDGWRQDQILSDYEWDSLRKNYNRLIEPEDAWILEARRLSMPQVSLYLGAWILTVGAALLFLFEFLHFPGFVSVLVVGLTSAFMFAQGSRLWLQEQLRIAMAYLLAFCLLLPIFLLVTMGQFHIFARQAQNQDWELLWDLSAPFRKTTNAQLWWSIFLSLPAFLWLRRFTHSSVFSLVLCVMGTVLCHVTLLRFGLLARFPDDPGWYYFRLLPIALLFFAVAFAVERSGLPNDSRYFYPVAVMATLAALSGLAAAHQPYQDWLKRTLPWTRGQIEYLFIINAGIYFVLQQLCGLFPSAQMRTVAKSFRFFIPGHILTSVLFLGLAATDRWNASPANLHFKYEARAFEVLLPILALGFVYGAIPKQMKNYFVTGMVFLAAGLIRLQQNLFEQKAGWPIVLLVLGLLFMAFATRYSVIKLHLARMFRRRT